MSDKTIATNLWGEKAKFSYLLLATILLVFSFLGAREIWTQEHRWADIVTGMFYRHDFLHPYLGQNNYYDKPLLSYWLIALVAQISGKLSIWALRIPSALASILAIYSIYQLGTTIKNKQLGLLAGWMLLTTFYFLFWSRISSADMLNLAGSLFATSWYMARRNTANFFDYSIFFLILAITSLCKGLIGAIIPIIAVIIDISLQKSWRKHLRFSLLFGTLPAILIYLAPFIASSYFGGESYNENGLYLVYRENILRYFQPFDHRGPVYTYFIYLPIYLLPSALLFFLPALFSLTARWKSLSQDSRWLTLTLLALFLFLTFSGSRRSYYVLPIVPFAILFTADWVLVSKKVWLREKAIGYAILYSCLLLFFVVDIAPVFYYEKYGINRFAIQLKNAAEKVKPWQQWNVILLDAETKLNFYLSLPPHVKNTDIHGDRDKYTPAVLAKLWPVLNNKPPETIFISRKIYKTALQDFFPGYQVIETPSEVYLPFITTHDTNAPIAFIPPK